MAPSPLYTSPNSLQRRLLNDIAEIKQNPYPNVHVHFHDSDLSKACLILTPDNEKPLHLTISFPAEYPLRAPTVRIQSRIVHPNVFGDYICATILNTVEGWTSAYTLKGLAIQLLSFFSSDSIEQDHGGQVVNLAEYRQRNPALSWDTDLSWGLRWSDEPLRSRPEIPFSCEACAFGPDWTPPHIRGVDGDSQRLNGAAVSTTNPNSKPRRSKLFTLPDEIVLLLLSNMGTRDIFAFADAVPTIKSMVYSYDFIRIRELQCFCLKKSFSEAKLGIGVSVVSGRHPIFRSEFDMLSQEAFFQHGIRTSIQGVDFDKWLPLPLSHRHWNQVRTNATACLKSIHDYAGMATFAADDVDVLYHFMNTIVVQFSTETELGYTGPDSRSTLSHASEKAVESYFSLFHLLLCLATENAKVVAGANRTVSRFLSGPRNKKQFPDLGHVLVAALISDTGLTEELTFQIIKEAVLRNVVWMLDPTGADMAELAYLEPSSISDYRLINTFKASPTSYRLLMFLKLFSSTARPPNKSLVEIREALFERHGAPPPGTSTLMAQQIHEIHEIEGFPAFLASMGIKSIPSKSEFTAFLRRTITESAKIGYSYIPYSQDKLYMIRKVREREVEIAEGVHITPELERWFEFGEKWHRNGWSGRASFFPNHGRYTQRDPNSGLRGSWVGGRGRGRGRGRGTW
ncbi:hypothetical protein IQ07DRAFT_593538 [Pyrenochaeta sp. DS3sAY3a]|nr:hypothetical protein IQ07DRAFT_593538 [Pyrenochaeta sp. DS3sAY3a]